MESEEDAGNKIIKYIGTIIKFIKVKEDRVFSYWDQN